MYITGPTKEQFNPNIKELIFIDVPTFLSPTFPYAPACSQYTRDILSPDKNLETIQKNASSFIKFLKSNGCENIQNDLRMDYKTRKLTVPKFPTST